MKDHYAFPAIFTFEENGISVVFPDLPGCLPCGANEDEALRNAKEALQVHLYGMEEDNENIPEPSKISDLTLEANQAIVLVEVWMPPIRDKIANKAVNKMVTLPKWLNDLAVREKVNVSHILQDALKKHFGIEIYKQSYKKQP